MTQANNPFEDVLKKTSMTPNTAAFLRHLGDDAGFWTFLENFADIVGFPIRNITTQHELRSFGRMIDECARQYDYLRDYHPQHFEQLDRSKALPAITAIAAQWYVVQEQPLQYFSHIKANAFSGIISDAFALRKATKESSGEEEIDNDTPPIYSLGELIALAHKQFNSKLGHIIVVNDYADKFGTYGSSDTREFALVLKTDVDDLSHNDCDEYGYVTIRPSWNVRMLTGEHRNQEFHVFASSFHANGAMRHNWVKTEGHRVDKYDFPLLTEEELYKLALLDAIDLSEKTVSVTRVSGYSKVTDDCFSRYFDYPAKVRAAPFRQEMFDRNYRIHEDGVFAVIDYDVDCTSLDKRLSDMRSLYFAGTSYYATGKMEFNDLFDEASRADSEKAVEPGFSC